MTDTFAAPRPKAPVHLWIVGILALLWNAMGAFDYLATKLPIEAYMSNFTQEQLDYFYSIPMWMTVAWAIGVWGGLLASLALLLRKTWAVWLFGLSLLGAIAGMIYSFFLSNGMEIMGTGGTIFSIVIIIVAIFLFLYARSMARQGILD